MSLFFTSNRTVLKKVPDFADLVFPPCCIITTLQGELAAHGVYIGDRLVVANTLVCDREKYVVTFTNSVEVEAEVVYRAERKGLCFLECPIAPRLVAMRKRTHPLTQGSFVFDMSLSPTLEIGLSYYDQLNESKVMTTQGHKSGAILFSRHGEVIGMRLARIKDRDFYLNASLRELTHTYTPNGST